MECKKKAIKLKHLFYSEQRVEKSFERKKAPSMSSNWVRILDEAGSTST